MTTACVLIVAGSDSGAGAGIQADLKTCAALGIYGLTAITAVTAQNSVEVRSVEEVSPKMIRAQIDAVMDDYPVRVLKTGMLHGAATVRCVAEAINHYEFDHVVVDPVMVAKSGDRLQGDEAGAELIAELLPRATVITPNLPEAEVLLNMKIEDSKSIRQAAEAIHNLSGGAVVMKGGHLRKTDLCVDLLFDGELFHEFPTPWVETRNDHGTGCTFASAVAALLARRRSVSMAVEGAVDYVHAALRSAANRTLGAGHGPLDHFPRPLPDTLL